MVTVFLLLATLHSLTICCKNTLQPYRLPQKLSPSLWNIMSPLNNTNKTTCLQCLVNWILSGLFSWPRVICSVLIHGARPGNVQQSARLRGPRTCQGARWQFSNWTPLRVTFQRLGTVGVPQHREQPWVRKRAKQYAANGVPIHSSLAGFLCAVKRMRFYVNL